MNYSPLRCAFPVIPSVPMCIFRGALIFAFFADVSGVPTLSGVFSFCLFLANTFLSTLFILFIYLFYLLVLNLRLGPN